MKTCPKCSKVFPDTESVCPDDGSVLLPGQNPQQKGGTIQLNMKPADSPVRPVPPKPPESPSAAGSAPGNESAPEKQQPPVPPEPDRAPTVDPAESSVPESADSSGNSLIGQTLENRYRINHSIGEGGMGIVYEAEHIEIEKKVAVKVLREDLSNQTELVERFKQEAKSASRIGHPNIVNVTDFGRTPDGGAFFVMEYLEGEDLSSLLERQGTLTADESVKIISQVCKALEAAHAQGIIHRDIKPENIFLARVGGERVIKILDFGIAKMSGFSESGKKLTRPGVVFGTPEYMSPEQAQGKNPDHRTDLYSVGIILWEMLAGHTPFKGDDFMAIISQHLFNEVPPIHEANPDAQLPVGMEQIITNSVAKKREERYQSAKHLMKDLERSIRGDMMARQSMEQHEEPEPGKVEGGPAPDVVITRETVSQPQKVNVAIIAGGTSAAVVLVAALIAWWFLKPEFPESSAQKMQLSVASQTSPKTPEKADKKEKNSEESTEKSTVTPGSMSKVTINTDPSHASVVLKDVGILCRRTPCTIQLPQGKKTSLILAKGRLRSVVDVTPSEPTESMDVKLSAAAPARKSRNKSRRSRKKTPVTKPAEDLKVPSF